jgi:hypothetical protein
VIDTFEDLATFILIANAICGGWLLPVVALLLIVIVSCGLWEVTSRLRRNRPRRPSVEELAYPAFNPDLDAWETSWRRQQERP